MKPKKLQVIAGRVITDETGGEIGSICSRVTNKDCRLFPVEADELTHEIAKRYNDHADILAALQNAVTCIQAIKARIQGEFDSPALVEFGPLGANTNADILAIINQYDPL